MSVMDLLDAQIARGRLLWTRRQDDAEIEEYDADFDWSLAPKICGINFGHLKYSPGCENLADNDKQAAFAPPEWTPPPSPANDAHGDEGTAEDGPSATPSKTVLSTPSPERAIPQTTDDHTVGHLRELSLDESSNGPTQSLDEKFPPSPLKVPHGVAMLEESVELGVPDVITQV